MEGKMSLLLKLLPLELHFSKYVLMRIHETVTGSDIA